MGVLYFATGTVCVAVIAVCFLLVGFHHDCIEWVRAHRRQRRFVADRDLMVDLSGRVKREGLSE